MSQVKTSLQMKPMSQKKKGPKKLKQLTHPHLVKHIFCPKMRPLFC